MTLSGHSVEYGFSRWVPKTRDFPVDEWTARMDVVERQFARMPAHTLDGVAAKLRRLHYSKHEGGDALPEKLLVTTALEGVEHLFARAS